MATDVVRGVEADAFETALSAITIRLDALSMATATFRSMVSDRLADYADQVARAQSITGRDLADSRRENERSLEEIERALKESDEGFRRLQRGIEALAGRADQAATANVVGHVGEQLHAVIEGSTREVTSEIRAARGELRDGLTQLEGSTAGALDQVATRVERLAQAAGDRAETTTEVANAVGELGRRGEAWSAQSALESRRIGEQLAGLRERLETLAENGPGAARLRHIKERIDAIADATQDQSELLGTLRRVETLVGALADQADQAALAERIDERFDTMDRALDQLARSDSSEAAIAALDSQLGNIELLAGRAVAPERTELLETVVERLAAIDRTVGELSDRPPFDIADAVKRLGRLETAIASLPGELAASSAPAGPGALLDSDAFRRVEDAVERLAAAQAEDLERILEAVEAQPAPVVPPVPEESVVADQLRALGAQIEGLRRRIALRARPAPALDEATIEALAAAVAKRLDSTRTTPAPLQGGSPLRRRGVGGPKLKGPQPDPAPGPGTNDAAATRNAGVRTHKRSS